MFQSNKGQFITRGSDLFARSQSISKYVDCNQMIIFPGKHATHFFPLITQLWDTKLINVLAVNQMICFYIFGLGWINSVVLNRLEFSREKEIIFFPRLCSWISLSKCCLTGKHFRNDYLSCVFNGFFFFSINSHNSFSKSCEVDLFPF